LIDEFLNLDVVAISEDDHAILPQRVRRSSGDYPITATLFSA